MSNLYKRQFHILQQQIVKYKNGNLPLNSLIQQIEGINAVIEDQAWTDSLFPILLSLEQVNATNLNSKQKLSEANILLVNYELLELEKLIADI